MCQDRSNTVSSLPLDDFIHLFSKRANLSHRINASWRWLREMDANRRALQGCVKIV